MKYRKLRIAWSAACGVACLLIVALWVRSYSHWDEATGSIGNPFLWGMSARGQLAICVGSDESPRAWTWTSYRNPRVRDGSLFADTDEGGYITMNFDPGFSIIADEPPPIVFVPHWFPAVLLLTLAAVPWIHWSRRFSLRTLLIAMTVAAIALGWSVYMLRK